MDTLKSSPPAMMPPPSPAFMAKEDERLRVLDEFKIEALEDDPELMAIVKFAANLCNVPVSTVSLLDDQRQYFLVRTGLEERETPRDISFCTHVLGHSAMMEVSDATKDDRFAANPLVTGAPGVRFYAGQPLVSDEGAPLGTLCVIDTEAHQAPLDDFQREGLAVLAQAAMRRLQARRESLTASRQIADSEDRFRALANSMPDIAFSADQEGNIDYFNRRWHEFTGLGGLPDRKMHESVLHPDEIEAINTAWAEAVRTGNPYEQENRLLRADGAWRWVLVRAVPVKVGNGDDHRWFGTITDVDDAHKLSESRDVLARELSHRIKNIFAVVSGLVSLQSRKKPEHKDFAEQLTQTLHALGRAHDFVRPSDGAYRENMKGLLEVIFAPYVGLEEDPRVQVRGVDCAIGIKATTPLALVFHELATNSAKYGALSVDSGHVKLEITDKGDAVCLLWKEHGGPAPVDSGENGFGSRMVELAVTGQLQGNWDRRFEDDGLAVSFELSKTAIAA